MFAFFSKRISLPKESNVGTVSWNGPQGWIACGGENGFLKVLKLDTGEGTSKNNLEMNYTLDRHKSTNGNCTVNCVAWNEVHRKLISSDNKGQTIVWVFSEGNWVMQMINVPEQQGVFVTDMAWSPDGEKVCICYNDGTVIMGLNDGNRIWREQLPIKPILIEWSFDSRQIYLGVSGGSIEVYDANSCSFCFSVPNFCFDKNVIKNVDVASIQWVDEYRLADPTRAKLMIAFSNGAIQLMQSITDPNPIVINTDLSIPRRGAKWAPDGFCFAVAGSNSKDEKTLSFISPLGGLLRSVSIPGDPSAGIDWDGTGQRVLVATPNQLFITEIRRQHLVAYADKTLVSAFKRRDREGSGYEFGVTFWDTATNERCSKIIADLRHLKSCDELTVLASVIPDAAEGPNVLLVLTGLGAGSITHTLPHEPTFVDMSSTHIIAASKNAITILNHAAPKKTFGLQIARTYSQPKDELVFHINDFTARNACSRARFNLSLNGEVPNDPICAVALGENTALIACESGNIYRYSLPRFAFKEKIQTNVNRMTYLSLNCDCSAMAVIDSHGVLTLWGEGVTENSSSANGNTGNGSQSPTNNTTTITNNSSSLENTLSRFPNLSIPFPDSRKEVWQVLWSSDSPTLLAVMEKNRLSVLRNGTPEEPITASATLLNFSDLRIVAVHPELLQFRPGMTNIASSSAQQVEAILREAVRELETKTLRDLKAILKNLPDLIDASAYADQYKHPRLWTLLAEAALERLDLAAAERGFAKVEDFRGLQFTRRLRQIDDRAKQHAEVFAFFGAFDEAERIYVELSRPDLAVELRRRLGDSFRVLQLVKENSQGGAVGALLADVDAQGSSSFHNGLTSSVVGLPPVAASAAVREAHRGVSEYLMDRSKWDLALEHLAAAGDWERLSEGLFLTERFEQLYHLGRSLPQGSSLCVSIGNRLGTAGLSSWAVEVLLKAPEDTRVKLAIDCCVQLSEWSTAIKLAEEHNYPQTETLLERYAENLHSRGFIIQAVELYERAGKHLQSASLLRTLAADFALTGKLTATPADKEAAMEAKKVAERSIGGMNSFTEPLLRSPDMLKKIHLLAALQDESFRRKRLDEAIKEAEENDDDEVEEEEVEEVDEQGNIITVMRKKVKKLKGNTRNITTLNRNSTRKGNNAAAMATSLLGGGKGKKGDIVGTLLAADQATMIQGATQIGATKLGGANSLGGGGTDSPWRGVEAIHLYMLIHLNLNRGAEDDALRAACRLVDYDELIPTRIAFCLLALCAVRVRLWGEASKAFMRLESSSDIPLSLSKYYSDLAVQIFTIEKFKPENPPPSPERPQVPCPSCNGLLDDWAHYCKHCYHQLPFCVQSGRSIFTPGLSSSSKRNGGHQLQSKKSEQMEEEDKVVGVNMRNIAVIAHPQQGPVMKCNICHHFTFKIHAHTRKSCALCHSPVSSLIDFEARY